MSGLFGKTKMPDPEPPAPMPDPYDQDTTKRGEARKIRNASSTAQNKLAPVPGTIGKEFSRTTLG